MFYDDHPPPHFHAVYGEFSAQVAVEEVRLIEGNLPSRARRMVLEWAALHREELLEDWQLCREQEPLKRIAPLE
jgi:hypothetical protein